MASISAMMIPTNPSRPETQYIRSSQPARPTWDVDADPTKMAMLCFIILVGWHRATAEGRHAGGEDDLAELWARHGLHVSLSLVDHFPRMGRCQSGGYLARGYLSKPDDTEDEGSEIARMESDDSPRRMVWPRLTFSGISTPSSAGTAPEF